MFRSLSRDPLSISDLSLNIPDVEISTFRVFERSPVDGKSLAQVEFRKKYDVSILAIRRGERVLSNPGADMQLLGSDVVVALGAPDKIGAVIELFRSPEEGKV